MHLKLLNPDPKPLRVSHNGIDVIVPANSEVIVPYEIGLGIQKHCSTLEIVPATDEEVKAYEEKLLNEKREAKKRAEEEEKKRLKELEEELERVKEKERKKEDKENEKEDDKEPKKPEKSDSGKGKKLKNK